MEVPKDLKKVTEKVEGEAKEQSNGFVEFIREQGVVGISIGFVIGAASTQMVSAITEDLIDPLIGLVLGNAEGLQSFSITISDSEFKIGHLVYTFIDFVVIALVIYILVKILHVDKLDKKKPVK